jgi:hypothetical protein
MTTTADTTAAILAMLERRVSTARDSYYEIQRRIENVEATGDMQHEHVNRLRASSRWTEAQEALSEARQLAAVPAAVLTRTQRDAVRAWVKPNIPRRIERLSTGDALVRHGLAVSLGKRWYQLTDAGVALWSKLHKPST